MYSLKKVWSACHIIWKLTESNWNHGFFYHCLSIFSWYIHTNSIAYLYSWKQEIVFSVRIFDVDQATTTSVKHCQFVTQIFIRGELFPSIWNMRSVETRANIWIYLTELCSCNLQIQFTRGFWSMESFTIFHRASTVLNVFKKPCHKKLYSVSFELFLPQFAK